MERQIDRQALHAVATENETSLLIFKDLVMRERNSRRTNLNSYRHILQTTYKVNINREHFDEVFRKLDILGCGKVSGTPVEGIPYSIDWLGLDTRSIGAAGLDPSQTIRMAKFRLRGVEAEMARKAKAKKKPGKKVDPIKARLDRKLDRLAQFQKGLSASAASTRIQAQSLKAAPVTVARQARPTTASADAIFEAFKSNPNPIRLELEGVKLEFADAESALDFMDRHRRRIAEKKA